MTRRKSGALKKLEVVSPPDEEEQGLTWETGDKISGEGLKWMLPGRISLGGITILEGEKGVMKSTFSAALAAHLTTGKAFIGRRKCKPCTVVWLSGEDPVKDVVRPRLSAAGANVSRVVFPPVDERGVRYKPCFPSELGWLEATVERFHPALVVIDPLSSFIPPGCDLRNDQDIHDVLDPISELSFALGFSVLANRNLTKNRYASALDRGLGGAAVGGVARSILTIDWPDREKTQRILRVTAGNIMGNTPPLEFHCAVKAGVGTATGFTELDPAELAAQHPDDDEAERDVREDAKTMLRSLLSAGPVDVKVILEEAMSIQVSPRTLRTAKRELKITSHRVGKKKPAKWQWKRPEGGFPKRGG